MTQEEVEREIGIGRSYLSALENDKKRLNTDALIPLARLYGVSADYLIGLSNSAIDSGNISDTERQVIEEYRQLTTDQKIILSKTLEWFRDANRVHTIGVK